MIVESNSLSQLGYFQGCLGLQAIVFVVFGAKDR